MTVRFGVLVPQGWRLDLTHIKDPVEQYELMTRYGREAESMGYDSIWLYDHFHTWPTTRLESTFECWTSTAALARDTSTIRIGQMVTCNSYRNPALLARMASTVDVLSHGRLNFGIGAGWHQEEFTAYGYPFFTGPVRLKMLDEALQIIQAMWSEPYATFEGQYYRVGGAVNEPELGASSRADAQEPGVQRSEASRHIPVWIGGNGEKVTLRLAARYADACNLLVHDPPVIRHKLDVLREHCERLGRDYDSIIKSVHDLVVLLEPGESVEEIMKGYPGMDLDAFRRSNIIGTPEEVANHLQAQVEAGVQYIVVYFRGKGASLDTLRVFAKDVMSAFR